MTDVNYASMNHAPAKNSIIKALIGLLLLCADSLQAAVVEEVLKVPVKVTTIHGEEVAQNILVTVFRDIEVKSAPYLVFNHGRAGTAEGRVNLKRARYSDNSRYFVSLGFVVLLPTRIGYGETGGPDTEDSGPCDARQFAPAFQVVADQTLAVLRAAKKLPYVDLSRGLVAGQSFGGVSSLALSTLAVPGMLGAVNFSGGSGGNPVDRPGDPCSKGRLRRVIGKYGEQSTVPTLWFYSLNDLYWGDKLPKLWHRTFVEAGGRARFVQLPASGQDGHGVFTQNPESWKPAFERFVGRLGFE